jgi:hypothetical protein
MYTQTWNKYLPIIKILLKRSMGGDQTFKLNIPDFDKTGPAKKTSYKFSMQFRNAKAENITGLLVIAKDLATVLLQDPTIKDILKQNEYHISMDSKFQLSIKFIPKSVPVGELAESATSERTA